MKWIRRREFLRVLPAALVTEDPPVEWICPMDAEVRSATPGLCPRCRMNLVAGIPAPEEYPLRLELQPRAWRPNERLRMRFEVLHPVTGARVKDLQVIHERLFHLFVVSGDLEFFLHEHPTPQPDGTFLFETKLPKPGFYRLLGDFYPARGTPQLVVKTIFSAGSGLLQFRVPRLTPNLAPQRTRNLEVSLRTEPDAPLAGLKTMLFFNVDPPQGLELYLGAWGHLLVASADLLDMIHTHPFIARGGAAMQFNVTFPRPGFYRLWAQFQRNGEVNTAVFTVDVRAI